MAIMLSAVGLEGLKAPRVPHGIKREQATRHGLQLVIRTTPMRLLGATGRSPPLLTVR